METANPPISASAKKGRQMSRLLLVKIFGIVQPSNRGTAIGILLPLLHIVIRDPDARIVLLPSDHHVCDESILAAALQEAMRQLQARRNQILLLGISPEDDDPGLGYIVPGIADGSGVWRISHFVEKPSAALARSLIASEALWNTSIIVAHAKGLLQVLSCHFPRIVDEMRAVIEHSPCTGAASAAAVRLYRRLPDIDFSRQILETAASALRVLPVERCGWSDLGTPQRVAAVLRRLPGLDNEEQQSVGLLIASCLRSCWCSPTMPATFAARRNADPTGLA
jgi:mannose-1-phosphate guanylyltransferase